jgi:hypothetical protein
MRGTGMGAAAWDCCCSAHRRVPVFAGRFCADPCSEFARILGRESPSPKMESAVHTLLEHHTRSDESSLTRAAAAAGSAQARPSSAAAGREAGSGPGRLARPPGSAVGRRARGPKRRKAAGGPRSGGHRAHDRGTGARGGAGALATWARSRWSRRRSRRTGGSCWCWS